MALVFGRWCVAEELPWMGLRGASLLEQAWTWWRPWPWQTRFPSVWPVKVAEELPWMGVRRARLALERPAEAFKGFEAGQTAGLNTFKSTWPCLAAGVWRKSCLGWACGRASLLEQAWTWWRPWPWQTRFPSVWPVMFSGRVALDGRAEGEIGFGKACGSI